MKRKIGFSYESQVKLSLLFLILFLVLLNLGTLYLLGKTRMVLQNENQSKLRGASTTAGILWKNGKTENLQNGLEQLAFAFNFEHILILDKNQKVLASSKPILDSEIESQFGEKKQFAIIHKIPIFDPRTQNEVFVIIRTKGDYLNTLEKISRLDAIFRGAGVLLALFLGLILINAILRPYRLMRKKAEDVKIKPQKDKENVDFVVGVFSKTIEELRKKEKLLEDLLKGSERKAQKLSYFNQYILKSISNGVIICDMEGKIVSFNSAARRILGYHLKEVKDKKYQDLWAKDNLLFKLLEDILKRGKAHSGEEMEFVREDGEKLWLGISSSFIKDDKEDKLGAVLFFTDLTDLKRLQNEIAFREKMASLGEMSAGLAHELRNSMSTIWGFGKLLKKSLELNHPMVEVIDLIIKESHSTEEMLQKFLTFAKPIELVPKEVNLKEVLQESLTSIKEISKDISINLEIKEDLPLISGDPLLLKQCFQNIFQNSIDAMSQGGRLSINVEKALGLESKEDKDYDLVMVDISDTGEGIPEDELEKIFFPFFSSKEKGVGLGLSLVRKIIDLHKGKIEVRSEQNKGTTFKIYLPSKLKKVTAEI
jgi:PAS domain S-box-containing protein